MLGDSEITVGDFRGIWKYCESLRTSVSIYLAFAGTIPGGRLSEWEKKIIPSDKPSDYKLND